MDCQRFTVKHRLIQCKHWDKCHTLSYCLCEVDPEDDSLPPVKRTRAAKLPWPKRREQVLQLVTKQETITTATLMKDTNARHGTASMWINKLIKEEAIECKTPHRPGRYNHRPAVYQAISHKEKD